MKKIKLKYILVIIGFGIVVYSCKNSSEKETILTGSTSILVDESLLPIINDQVQVFESQYDAKIKLIPISETESIISLTQKKANIAILTRKLYANESAIFANKKIVPTQTPFAIDAIALIKNKNSNDTLVDVSTIVDFLKGENTKFKGLVFDNPNSSTTRYFLELAGLKTMPEKGVYSFKTNNEVIKYVAQNDGMIGVIGINWIMEPSNDTKNDIDKINLLSVKNTKTQQYVTPNQETIGSREYPLARVLYSINCQGYDGLGMGFSSFIAGETGQRIILKSGLAPLREPSRNITIRKKIENN